MRIGIDARLYGAEGRGLGRYIAQLLLHLEGIDHENEYIVFLTKKGFAEYHSASKNFKKILCDIPWYGVKEQFVLPRILKREQCDLVHFPHFNVPLWYQGKFVATIHDFILYDFPTTRATTRSALTFWVKYAAYRFVFWSAIQRAQHIFVPSRYVCDRLQYHYPLVGEAKVTVTEEGNYMLKSDLPREVGLRNIDDHYILVVGSAYPHKNLEALIHAFTNLTKLDFVRLVIVGKKDYFMAKLANISKSHFDRIEFVGEVGDRELAGLYAGARAIAVVSCEEGFGLPGVEAMRYGTPVIASDRSSLPEVYRNRAYYVNPYDVQDIARVLQEVMQKERFTRMPLVATRGILVSDEEKTRLPLSEASAKEGIRSEDVWQRLAEETKAVYESVI